MFSDHVPVEVKIKVDYEEKQIVNELNKLWNKLKEEDIKEKFRDRL